MTPTPWPEQLVASFTRESWIRNRGSIEATVAIAVFLLTVVSSLGSGGQFLIGLLLALASGGAVLLHRRMPLAALAIVAAVLVAVVGFWALSYYFGVPDGGLSIFILVALLVLFGTSAYGSRAVAWTGGGFVAFAAIVVGAMYVGAGVTGVLGSAATAGAVLGLSWILGWVIRVTFERRSAQSTAAVAVAQRDELEVSVALEQERNRVARDVHDIVAHSLAVVIAQADGARYLAKKNPETVDEALETIATTARGALSDVRLLLTELRHTQEPGPQPGMADFDSLIRSFRESGLVIEWTSYGTATPLGDASGLAVYRIVQEALTNSLRHGGRDTPVDLEFDWTEGAVTITITNDLQAGERSSNTSGHGIPGMRERAALAGGSFSAGEGTNGRFRVRATLPIDRAATPTQPMAIRSEDRP